MESRSAHRSFTNSTSTLWDFTFSSIQEKRGRLNLFINLRYNPKNKGMKITAETNVGISNPIFSNKSTKEIPIIKQRAPILTTPKSIPPIHFANNRKRYHILFLSNVFW